MIRIHEIRLDANHSESDLRQAACARLNVSGAALLSLNVVRRNHDARSRNRLFFSYTVDVTVEDEDKVLSGLTDPKTKKITPVVYEGARKAPHTAFKRPVVIGTGPCGIFAAIVLAEAGYKPVVIERGKPVRERSADTFSFWRERKLNPESNVQFGEGGAGTFSDGKLHSQIRDPRQLARKVLSEYVAAGAPEEILYLGKPHIGTFKLVRIAQNLREKIISLGGEFHFETRIDDIEITDGQVTAVIAGNGRRFETNHVLCAPGHSARDTFAMLYEKGIAMEAKPFSVGFRIEHPQSMIDTCRLGAFAGHPMIGAADYKLVHHASNGRGVYSFCMCPGGTVVAAASEEGRLVTNGMSQYSRSERNANAAIVVDVSPDDFGHHPLDGIAFQRSLEEKAFELGGGNYNAPAQKVTDFLADRTGTLDGAVAGSYQPGLTAANLRHALPDFAVEAMTEALRAFGKKIPGFDGDKALLTGTETRTSSPLRILRGKDSFESVSVKGFFPAGEGAGYAGGILSSAVDGICAAEALAISVCQAADRANN